MISTLSLQLKETKLKGCTLLFSTWTIKLYQSLLVQILFACFALILIEDIAFNVQEQNLYFKKESVLQHLLKDISWALICQQLCNTVRNVTTLVYPVLLIQFVPSVNLVIILLQSLMVYVNVQHLWHWITMDNVSHQWEAIKMCVLVGIQVYLIKNVLRNALEIAIDTIILGKM